MQAWFSLLALRHYIVNDNVRVSSPSLIAGSLLDFNSVLKCNPDLPQKGMDVMVEQERNGVAKAAVCKY